MRFRKYHHGCIISSWMHTFIKLHSWFSIIILHYQNLENQSTTAAKPVGRVLHRSASYSEPQYKPHAAIGRCNSFTFMSGWARAAMAGADSSLDVEGFMLCFVLHTNVNLHLMSDRNNP